MKQSTDTDVQITRSVPWDDPSIAAIRHDMLRFARLQLRDAGAAEDMVQDALIAAMTKASEFAGRSALKTWIFAILRNKIVDHIRRSSREICGSDLVGSTGVDGDDFDKLFDQHGFWNPDERPATWSDPDASLSQKQFWAVFDACLNNLPEQTARVYMMREFLELETVEICQQLGISTSNCWVILHRARIGLRECLETKWFHGDRIE
ncbi:MAG: sigma-70 family RNA polymerase sigma factor [Rhodocyclales bacterium]|nr:sigma-70 family RNA polymerase sigma factor [Rhodocyclales bacterium]